MIRPIELRNFGQYCEEKFPWRALTKEFNTSLLRIDVTLDQYFKQGLRNQQFYLFIYLKFILLQVFLISQAVKLTIYTERRSKIFTYNIRK